ncbi:hypothetical protein BRADI_1g75477v3 [Brachypodium distachyon]|uniref:Uncharacterized protein n=1 Tax=Brachypodium distachyon TaxID=15368 RepID=A0A2K2DVC6_BRADI|nr:hypothetical protein BRADI_1g75477v3 [Brachypodium distachyon]
MLDWATAPTERRKGCTSRPSDRSGAVGGERSTATTPEERRRDGAAVAGVEMGAAMKRRSNCRRRSIGPTRQRSVRRDVARRVTRGWSMPTQWSSIGVLLFRP